MKQYSGRHGWLMQIVTIENKGYDAFKAGVPKSECPYQDGCRNTNGAGGSVQQQRRRAWCRGWELAERHKKDGELL